MWFNPPTSHQTIRIVRSGIFSAITVPAVQSRNTSGAMPSFIVYFSSLDLCFLILVMFVRLVTMGVDYSKKDVKVIKSVDKAQGKAVSRMVVSTCKMVVVSSPFTVFQSCSLQESYFTNMQHLAPYFDASRILFYKHATLGTVLCRTLL